MFAVGVAETVGMNLTAGQLVTVYLPTASRPDREPKYSRGRIARRSDGRVVDDIGYYWIDLDTPGADGARPRCIARIEDMRIEEANV